MLLKLLQVDGTCNTEDDVQHSDVPTVTVPHNDDCTSDAANKNRRDPTVCDIVSSY